MAEDAWNSRDSDRVVQVYTEDTVWRNRAEFPVGQQQVHGFLQRKWLNVASTLEVKPLRRAFLVILPAAAPTILTGMRISMGIAWLVIVAAEMLVGGTGIGYFVWNEWNTCR